MEIHHYRERLLWYNGYIMTYFLWYVDGVTWRTEMKILIADDEVLTRQGLRSNIDWVSLQIKEVIEADDGQRALELAIKHSPDIVLTDIRMPRMDGVTLATKLREQLPNTSIIFMSGYSDKEYLKAAIKLKATSYVEKPINHQEVISAIEEAIKTRILMMQNKYSKNMQYITKSSQLAHILTRPFQPEDQELQDLIKELQIDFLDSNYFQTFLVKFKQGVSLLGQEVMDDLYKSWKKVATAKKISLLFTIKNDNFIVLHLYAKGKIGASTLADFVRYIRECLEQVGNFFLALGSVVHKPELIYESYNSAVMYMQGSFFYAYNSVLSKDSVVEHNLLDVERPSKGFVQAVMDHDFEKAKTMAKEIYESFKKGNTLLPSRVKDIYYKLFIATENEFVTLMIPQKEENTTIWDAIYECQILEELHGLLVNMLDKLIYAIEYRKPENPIIFMMKDFIHKNYSKDYLSVKDIGEHAQLSTAYACTLFKNETGQTLNQYLTDYRIERAKQLLGDPRYKISEISSKVGYTDGNYFTKSFKKSVGLSP